MTNEDKLRFEVVGGFNLLSSDKIADIISIAVSRPLTDSCVPSCRGFCRAVKELTNSEENFIQVISLLSHDYKVEAYTIIEDKELKKYAAKFLLI